VYSEVRNLTAPYLAPRNLQFINLTNSTSIAFSWLNMSYDVQGSGGLNCDYKIWYYNNSISKKVLLANSTKGKLIYKTS
jgi:hypothetical protein